MAYIDHIQALNRWNPENFLPFRVDGMRMGWIRHRFAEHLAEFPECFVISSRQVKLNPELEGFEQRSNAVAAVLEHMAESGAIRHLQGEMFPVLSQFGKAAAFKVDRAVVSQFGIRAFGQHLNGFMRTGDGLAMWVGRRASDRRAFPDHLDHLVAGGLPYGISLAENLAKECREEADIPESLAATAKAVGQISYCCEVQHGLRNDTIFCYDLLLPENFIPFCTDGEVASFELMPMEQLAEVVCTSEAFKSNCNLVIIDFLLRHDFITSEHKHYQALIDGLNKRTQIQPSDIAHGS